jgi:hypothetical protein
VGTSIGLGGLEPATDVARDEAESKGFRFGDKGTHTSRTLMTVELAATLAAVPPEGGREDYARAIIEQNCTGKRTVATRRLTNQRLGELYGLDPTIPIFRILRRLWQFDSAGRPLLALLCGIARDPLLAATARPVIDMPPDTQFPRMQVMDAVREAVGDRLNDNVLAKVVRNAASSWSQSGHLHGRTFKYRQRVTPTVGSVAYALFLAHAVGVRGRDLLSSAWVGLLDCSPGQAEELALEAKRVGLIDLQMAADVFYIAFERLDPWQARK